MTAFAASQAAASAQFERRTHGLGSNVARFIGNYFAQWRPYRPHWNYEDGCIYKGCLDLADATGEHGFVAFVHGELMRRIDADGLIDGYDADEFNIDNINAGKALFPFAGSTEPRFRIAIESLAGQLAAHPRTRSGNYWHKRIYPHQVWLDGLYMAQPYRCAYARLIERPAACDDVARQFAHVRAVMRDEQSGLYYHGWDESRSERWSNSVTGCSASFWGRALGWFMMAMVDCIELAPQTNPERFDVLRSMLRDAAAALLAVRSTNGLWYQVLDRGGLAGNYEEASASLMIAYAFMKGARLGALDAGFRALGLDSLASCVRRFVSDHELGGICAVAGLGNVPYRDGSYAYYLSEPVVANDPKGVGAFLMALAESQRPAS